MEDTPEGGLERAVGNDGASLFEQVCTASGLAGIIAHSALRRAIVRAGFDPNTLTRAQLAGALPAIRQAIGVFLPEKDADERAGAVGRLARRPGA